MFRRTIRNTAAVFGNSPLLEKITHTQFCFVYNDRGMGLVAAIFIIVILAVFGMLIARFTSTTSVTSVEDYLWAQALYSAEAAAQLRILNHDGGGNWGGFSYPVINNFTITPVTDSFSGAGSPATLDVLATRATVVREIQVKYIL
jgi:hypothetical protein